MVCSILTHGGILAGRVIVVLTRSASDCRPGNARAPNAKMATRGV